MSTVLFIYQILSDILLHISDILFHTNPCRRYAYMQTRYLGTTKTLRKNKLTNQSATDLSITIVSNQLKILFSSYIFEDSVRRDLQELKTLPFRSSDRPNQLPNQLRRSTKCFSFGFYSFFGVRYFSGVLVDFGMCVALREIFLILNTGGKFLSNMCGLVCRLVL